MWSSQRSYDSCAGSAVKAAYAAMKTLGGKLSIFLASAPTVGDLVGHRDSGQTAATGTTIDRRMYMNDGKICYRYLGTDRDTELLKPANELYKQLATVLTQAQISVDLYASTSSMNPSAHGGQPSAHHSATSIDIPTLSQLVQFTAGELRCYPAFNALASGDKLRQELVHSLTRLTG